LAAAPLLDTTISQHPLVRMRAGAKNLAFGRTVDRQGAEAQLFAVCYSPFALRFSRLAAIGLGPKQLTNANSRDSHFRPAGGR